MAENIGEQVIERPNGTRLIKSVYRNGTGFYALLGGKRQRLEDRGKVVDSRGKKVFEFAATGPGRPNRYGERRRVSLTLSMELIAALDARRNGESQSIHIEQELRKAWGMAPLQEQL